jgi:hypothetical protein
MNGKGKAKNKNPMFEKVLKEKKRHKLGGRKY